MKHLRTYRHVPLALVAAVVAALALAPAAQAAPANDDFTSATTIAPEVTEVGNNDLATKETGEPDHAGNAGGHSVWFKWVPTKNGIAGINTNCFDTLDPLLAVYTGAAIGALTEVVNNENGPPPFCFSTSEEVEFEVSAGTTYWIAVDGRDGDQGGFNLQLRTIPPNDAFATPTAITPSLPQTISGSTRHATKQDGEPDHAADPGGHSVWFTWTAPTDGPVEISTCTGFQNPSTDTLLAVYTGSALGALTPVAANDDAALAGTPGCSGRDSGVELDAVAGTEYRIAVDGASDTSVNFSLRLRGRPQNDDFEAPEVLSQFLPTSAFQASNRFATEQGGEPDHAGVAGGRSTWFSWTAPFSGPVGIWTCTHERPSRPDTLLAVYTGSALGALNEVAANDDGPGARCAAGDSEVEFDAVSGTTYRIAVDSEGAGQGRFDLNLESPGANDDFGSAQTLSPSLPVSTLANTAFATKETGEPDHAGQAGNDSVWFSWTPSASGPVTVSACPYGEARPDTALAIYTGASVNALTPVAANDDSPAACRGVGSLVKLSAVAGTTYRIAVDSKPGTAGMFGLEIQPPEGNDDFADAAAIPASPTTGGGSTLFATKEAEEPNHAGLPGGRSAWFKWTPDASGPVELTACGKAEGIDTLLAVYTGSDLGALTEVAANDDAPANPPHEFCEGGEGISEVVFDAVAGTTYRIAVDAKGGAEGRFGLAFLFRPENDAFAAPRVIDPVFPGAPGMINKLASKQAGEPNHVGNAGGHSLWFSWTPTETESVDVFTCTYADNLDALLAVYTGSALGALTPVAANDDAAAGECRSTDSGLRLNAVAGQTYRIAVDGKAGSTGGFHLRFERAAGNDLFGKPQGLGTEIPIETWGSNRFAGVQGGEPVHADQTGGASVWFKWSATRAGKVSIDTCGTRFDTLLAVYTGGSVNQLTEVAANDDGSAQCGSASRLSFDAVANTVYRIAVDGKGGAEGTFDLSVDQVRENDAFAAAEKTPGARGWWVPGSTIFAGKEVGEPDHAGDSGGHSVWYSWTPKTGGPTELNACSDSFDLLIGIYTGSALGALGPVATTDLGECEEGGRALRFDAVAGTTYRFAIDGAGGDEGHFLLHLTGATASPRTLTVAKAGTGTGRVSSSPAGIDCGSACAASFETGTAVTLSAVPAAGSAFAGWSGGGCTGTGACQVTLGADTTVSAEFIAVPAGGGGNGGGVPGGGSGSGNPKPPTPPKPLRCKAGFKKVKVRGKQKCVKKKKPAKGKGKKHGQKR